MSLRRGGRVGAALLFACGIGIAVAACSGDDRSGGPNYAIPDPGYGGGGGSGPCSQFTTCGTCTPVDGCGWCFNSTLGVCSTDPDSCLNVDVSEFTWAWDPPDCPGIDASVGSVDAGAVPEASVPEASVPEASAPEGSSFVPSDAALPIEASPGSG